MKIPAIPLLYKVLGGLALLVVLVLGFNTWRTNLIADAYKAGKTAAEKVCTDTKNAEIAKGVAAFAEKQKRVDLAAVAEEATAGTADALAAIDARLAKLPGQIGAQRRANPLPVTCRADTGRMRNVAEARGGAP